MGGDEGVTDGNMWYLVTTTDDSISKKHHTANGIDTSDCVMLYRTRIHHYHHEISHIDHIWPWCAPGTRAPGKGHLWRNSHISGRRIAIGLL